jgi:GNAT superfamily N-acetyltransferase
MVVLMQLCSLHNKLEIVRGDMGDYEQFVCYHYRGERPASVKAVFIARHKAAMGSLHQKPVGAIVYAMPVPRVELRHVATGNLFKGLDRQTQLALLNRNIRCIARVVIEPRFRGIGLATRLVRETMPQMDVPIVEAVGVMPLVNPFLEKAGMKVFAPRLRLEHIELVEALSTAGIEEDTLIDPAGVQNRLDALPQSVADFIETRVRRFLKSHGTRRTMPPGIERTRYVLSKLTERPAYHIWFHPTLEVTLP